MKTIQQLRIENAIAKERLSQLQAVRNARMTNKVSFITKSSLVIARLKAAAQDLKHSLEVCGKIA